MVELNFLVALVQGLNVIKVYNTQQVRHGYKFTSN